MSGDSPPDLHMLNVVVGDMAASLDSCRRLGIAVPGPGDAGAHVQLKMPGGFSLELDTAESARLWHAGWRADPDGNDVGLMSPVEESRRTWPPSRGTGTAVGRAPYPARMRAGRECRVTALVISDHVCENSRVARCPGSDR